MFIRFTYYSLIQFFIISINARIAIFRINCKNKKNINRTLFLKKKYDSVKRKPLAVLYTPDLRSTAQPLRHFKDEQRARIPPRPYSTISYKL